MRVLTDQDVERALTAEMAIGAARRALADAYRGTLSAPPRAHVTFGENGFVFTAGGYLAGPLGAVAVDLLARADAHRIGVIGSGEQAWSQLWAIAAVRAVEHVAVYGPTPEHRERFAARARTELELEARAVSDPHEAVEDADIVGARHAVADTRNRRVVGRPRHAHHHDRPQDGVRTRGAGCARVHRRGGCERRARTGHAYADAFFTPRPLEHLGRLVAERDPPRRADTDMTLYCSTGLAGSEVVIADALLRRPAAPRTSH